MEINFSEQYQFRVSAHSEELEELGVGSLTFGKDIYPKIAFENVLPEALQSNERQLERVYATTTLGTHFTLLKCTISSFGLFAEFVVAGKLSEIRTISIRFSQINEWFAPFTNIRQLIGKSELDQRPVNHINAKINGETQQLFLQSESIVSDSRHGENHVVHEHFMFHYTRLDGAFSPDDVRARITELSALFSVLQGMPIHLASVKLAGPDDSPLGTYFPYYSREKEADEEINTYEYLCINPHLEGQWQMIVNNFYSSRFRAVWIRLSGMKHYDSFWEFRLLGYISLLEHYVNLRCNGISGPSTRKQESRNARLLSALRSIKPSLAEEQIAEVMNATANIFPKGKKLDFSDKWKVVMDQTDPAIRAIINFGDSHFDIIKDLRDAIAHGDNTVVPDNDHTQISIAINKIILLLTYFCFDDLGLGTVNFLKCFNTHSPIHSHAEIDRVEWERAMKPENFFQVSREDFALLSDTKGIRFDSCFIRTMDNKLTYSKYYSDKFRKHYISSHQGVRSFHDILGVDKHHCQFRHVIYFEHGAERLEVVGACIIDFQSGEHFEQLID